ncbi:hypothetical protein P8A18_31260 [Streptomyces castrisilvae]|uniref:Gluconate 2-dehydrogenase subunit 3 family protein n=1 Tax=Streptomyces castrisilvae TaxID=3033811 RepID=A0ABY9HTJ8_9ACTN|nr:hypothetical protein [Streptomyces sp. Mut1]WLQ37646.1 hypothetical protein P8A18_31260 [Streptomyces sp. Mut1]
MVHLLQIFGLGTQSGLAEAEAQTIEKLLDVSPGRRQRVEGSEPWLTGPVSAFNDAADFVSLPRMAEAPASATNAEWQEARSLAAAFFLQLPVFPRALVALTGKGNFAGMDGTPEWDSEPFFAVILIAFVSRCSTCRGTSSTAILPVTGARRRPAPRESSRPSWMALWTRALDR